MLPYSGCELKSMPLANITLALVWGEGRRRCTLSGTSPDSPSCRWIYSHKTPFTHSIAVVLPFSRTTMKGYGDREGVLSDSCCWNVNSFSKPPVSLAARSLDAPKHYGWMFWTLVLGGQRVCGPVFTSTDRWKVYARGFPPKTYSMNLVYVLWGDLGL